jgi:P27 family predicted phage terminase small subunit
MTDVLKPPPNLRASTRRWFEYIVRAVNVTPAQVSLLGLACEQLDACWKASRLIDKEGLVITQPSGQRTPHPALRIRRESAKLFEKLVKDLGLADIGLPDDAPQALRSVKGGWPAGGDDAA